MSAVNTLALEQFLNKVRALQRSKSKQLVISAEEANDLAASIALVLLENSNLSKQANDQSEKQVIEITLGGGTFGK